MVAAVAIVLLVGVTAAQRERITVLEVAVRESLRPALASLARVADAVGGTVQTAVSLPRIRSERAQLEAELARTAQMQQRVRILEEENRRLRALLGFPLPAEWQRLGAQVVGRNGDSWLSRLAIDQGSRAGVTVNAAVVTDRGLVGRVSSVSPSLSIVTLISDPGSVVATVVAESGEAGVCYGQVGTDLLRMRFFSREAQVAPGDTVLTSGLGGVFPPHLMVGTVVETFRGDYGLVQYATVRPAADLDRLWQVVVLAGASRSQGSGAPGGEGADR